MNSGSRCQVPKSTRHTTCISCREKKKKCSVKGIVNKLVARGKLGTPDESANLKISSKEDVVALGLGMGAERILIQLVSFQQEMNERLGAIEARLDAMETREGVEGSGDGDGGSGGEGSGNVGSDEEDYYSGNGDEGDSGEVEMSDIE